MNKQTAVELLVERLTELGVDLLSHNLEIQQAKAMEKEQIVDAVNLPKEERWYDAKLYNSSGEQYYNKIYEK